MKIMLNCPFCQKAMTKTEGEKGKIVMRCEECDVTLSIGFDVDEEPEEGAEKEQKKWQKKEFGCSEFAVCSPSEIGFEEIEKLSPGDWKKLIVRIIDLNADALFALMKHTQRIVEVIDKNSDVIENDLNAAAVNFNDIFERLEKLEDLKTNDK